MTSSSLEKRVVTLEQELAKLKRKVESADMAVPWWERIAGTFADDSIYRQAMKLGREYRESLQPPKPSRRRKQK